MTYSGIKGIIFDLGSTLVEYENRSWVDIAFEGQRLGYELLIDDDHCLPEFEEFNNRLEAIKGEFREEARESLMEWTADDAPLKLLTDLGLSDPKGQSRIFMQAFYGVVRDQLTVEEGAPQTLKAIKKLGLKTGLISNTIFAPEEHEVDIEIFGLSPYLDFRIYSSGFGKRKPHPDIFRAGLEKIGLPADETIYVGDRFMEDVEGPLGVGMRPVLKARPGREYPYPMPEDIPIIQNLSELLDVI